MIFRKIAAAALAAGAIAFAWDMGRFIPAYSRYLGEYQKRQAAADQNFPGRDKYNDVRKLSFTGAYLDHFVVDDLLSATEADRDERVEDMLLQRKMDWAEEDLHYMMTFLKEPSFEKNVTERLMKKYGERGGDDAVAQLEMYFADQKFRDAAAPELARVALRLQGKERRAIARQIFPTLRELLERGDDYLLDIVAPLYGSVAADYYLDGWKETQKEKYLTMAATLAEHGALPTDKQELVMELRENLLADMGTCYVPQARALRRLSPDVAASVARAYRDSHRSGGYFDWRKECRNRMEFLLEGGKNNGKD